MAEILNWLRCHGVYTERRRDSTDLRDYNPFVSTGRIRAEIIALAMCIRFGYIPEGLEGHPMKSVTLEPGDCLDVMLEMAARDEQFDSLITDPPYHLTSVVKRFGGSNAAPAKPGTDGLFARQSRGFMGKQWDGGDIAFRPYTWQLAYALLKPGSYLLAFSSTRTYHRMACAIEDAGFEIRDQIGWLYGTGFPKSLNVGNGWGTALKPAWEPIVVARKPLIGTVAANVLAHGVGAMNIDACRIPGIKPQVTQGVNSNPTSLNVAKVRQLSGAPDEGRWPANVIHDGSDEVEAAFAAFGESKSGVQRKPLGTGGIWSPSSGAPCGPQHGDSGTASRFFYSAKANDTDRAGSKHPTVKPLALMHYLCKLVTPKGGTILDPFSGSGTTLEAAFDCGFNAVGIEREAEYQADILRRLERIQTAYMAAFA